MITDVDPLRGLLFYQDLGFSLTLHVLLKRSGGANTPSKVPPAPLKLLAVEDAGFGYRCSVWSKVLVAQVPLQGSLERDHAGHLINKLSRNKQ